MERKEQTADQPEKPKVLPEEQSIPEGQTQTTIPTRETLTKEELEKQYYDLQLRSIREYNIPYSVITLKSAHVYLLYHLVWLSGLQERQDLQIDGIFTSVAKAEEFIKDQCVGYYNLSERKAAYFTSDVIDSIVAIYKGQPKLFPADLDALYVIRSFVLQQG